MDTKQKKQDLSFLIEEKQKQKAEYIEYIEWYDSIDKRNMEANQLRYTQYKECKKEELDIRELLSNLRKSIEEKENKIKELKDEISFFDSIFNPQKNKVLIDSAKEWINITNDGHKIWSKKYLDKLEELEELKKSMNISFKDIERYKNFNREEIEKNIVSLSKEIEELEKEKQNL